MVDVRQVLWWVLLANNSLDAFLLAARTDHAHSKNLRIPGGTYSTVARPAHSLLRFGIDPDIPEADIVHRTCSLDSYISLHHARSYIRHHFHKMQYIHSFRNCAQRTLQHTDTGCDRWLSSDRLLHFHTANSNNAHTAPQYIRPDSCS